MGELLSYSINSGIFLLAMFLTYRLLMARDNQHSFNRGILLLIYFLSFIALPIIISVNLTVATTSKQFGLNGFGIVNNATASISKPMWGTILIWTYIAGMIVVFCKTIRIWVKLTNVIRNGKKIKRNGYTLVLTDNEKFAPFSWMCYVVISLNDYENDYSTIATHELKHVASRHWIDLLIAQIICVMNWFNPAAWLMRDELMLIHEYQADMAVIDNGHDPQEYQMLLIKKAVGTRFPSLANSLNHSNLKKRITMMYKEKSGAGHKFKALALVPMLALAIGLASVPAVRAAVSTISSSDISVGKDSKKTTIDNTTGSPVMYFKTEEIRNDGKETTVVIRGKNLGNTMIASGGTFTNNGKTYQAKSMNFNMSNGEAEITLSFPFAEEYKNASMTITVNGEEIPFNLENFFSIKTSL